MTPTSIAFVRLCPSVCPTSHVAFSSPRESRTIFMPPAATNRLTRVRWSEHEARKFHMCSNSQAKDVSNGEALTSSASSSSLISLPEIQRALPLLLAGTQLDGKALGRLFCASNDGWNNDRFFEENALFPGGLPTLVLGRTEEGRLFGAYNAVGFDRRDDFRDSARCFLFTFPEGDVLISRPTTPQGLSAVFDFGDCAIKMGAADLVIPMNKEKYLLNANQARSNLGANYCVLESKEITLFGTSTLSTLVELETYVTQAFIEEAQDAKSRRQKPPLGFLDLFRNAFSRD